MSTGEPITIKKYWKEVLAAAFFCGAVFFIVSAILPPTYKSNATILIVQKDASGMDAYKESKSAEFAGRVMKEVIYSNSFMEAVMQNSSKAKDIFAKETDPSKRLENWRDSIAIDQVVNTGVLNISSYAKERVASRDVLNSVIETLQNQGKQYHGNEQLEVKVISKPYFLTNPAYPNLMLNTSIGAILGVLAVVAGVGILGEKMLFFRKRRPVREVADTLDFAPRHAHAKRPLALQYNDEKYFTEFQKRFSTARPEAAEAQPEKKQPEKPRSIEIPDDAPMTNFVLKKVSGPETAAGTKEPAVEEKVTLIKKQESKTEDKKFTQPVQRKDEIPVFITPTQIDKTPETSKKAPAPENLPFAQDEAYLVKQEKTVSVENQETPKVEQKEQVTIEKQDQPTPAAEPVSAPDPTEEEIKERLNKLLKGEL